MTDSSSIYFPTPDGRGHLSRAEESTFFGAIRVGQRAAHTLSKRWETLDEAEYANLIEGVQAGRRAEQEVFERNRGLVFAVVKRLSRLVPQVDFEDLLQPGAVALTRAVRQFDPRSSSARFATYAHSAIERAITREVEDLMSQGVPMPRHIRSIIVDLQWLETQPSEKGPKPNAALRLGCTAQELAEARRVMAVQKALPLGEAGFYGLAVPDPSAQSLMRVAVQQSLGQLRPASRQIIGRYFGLDSYEATDSLEEIATDLRLPVPKVEKKLQKALKRLRVLLGDDDGDSAIAI